MGFEVSGLGFFSPDVVGWHAYTVLMRLRSSCLLATSLAILLIVLSFLPGSIKALLHTKGRGHLWGHFLSFLGVTIAWLRTCSNRLRSVVLMAALAIGLEVTQRLVYKGEHFEWEDVLVDMAGIALAAFLRPKSRI